MVPKAEGVPAYLRIGLIMRPIHAGGHVRILYLRVPRFLFCARDKQLISVVVELCSFVLLQVKRELPLLPRALSSSVFGSSHLLLRCFTIEEDLR